MDNNPIISAKLEFLATVLTGVAVGHAAGTISDDDALEQAMEALDAFIMPLAPLGTNDAAEAASA